MGRKGISVRQGLKTFSSHVPLSPVSPNGKVNKLTKINLKQAGREREFPGQWKANPRPRGVQQAWRKASPTGTGDSGSIRDAIMREGATH